MAVCEINSRPYKINFPSLELGIEVESGGDQYFFFNTGFLVIVIDWSQKMVVLGLSPYAPSVVLPTIENTH